MFNDMRATMFHERALIHEPCENYQSAEITQYAIYIILYYHFHAKIQKLHVLEIINVRIQ